MVSLFILVNIVFFINSLQFISLNILNTSLYTQVAIINLDNLHERLKAAGDKNSEVIILKWRQDALGLPNRHVNIIQRNDLRIFQESWGGNCKAYHIGLSGCLELVEN